MRKGQYVAMVINGSGFVQATVERVASRRGGKVTLEGKAPSFPNSGEEPGVAYADGKQYVLYPLRSSGHISVSHSSIGVVLKGWGGSRFRPPDAKPLKPATRARVRAGVRRLLRDVDASREKPIEDKTVRFHSPHDGVSGAAAPLPKKVRQYAIRATRLKNASLSFVAGRVKAIAGEGARVSVHADCLTLTIGDMAGPGIVHCWRVLKFDEVKPIAINKKLYKRITFGRRRPR